MTGPYRIIKNASFDLWWFAKDTSGQVSTGATGPSATRSIDGAAFAATTNTPAETPASSGQWKLTLSVADMSGDNIGVKVAYTGPRTPEGFILNPEPAFDSGVAQAGAASTITLRAGAPSTSLVGAIVEIVRGTGSTQRPRLITAYDTTSKVATVRPDWSTNPDNTSVYKVTFLTPADLLHIDSNAFPAQFMAELYNTVKVSTFNSGSTTTVLKTNMTGYGTDQLVGMALVYLGNTGNYGIFRPIVDYNSTTGDITVFPAFNAAPTASERFAVFGTTG